MHFIRSRLEKIHGFITYITYTEQPNILNACKNSVKWLRRGQISSLEKTCIFVKYHLFTFHFFSPSFWIRKSKKFFLCCNTGSKPSWNYININKLEKKLVRWSCMFLLVLIIQTSAPLFLIRRLCSDNVRYYYYLLLLITYVIYKYIFLIVKYDFSCWSSRHTLLGGI